MPQLDAAWGVDTARTIALLTAFLDRFPDYAPARDKLYAALLTYGAERVDEGDVAGATQAFTQAARLLPDREEAPQALASLTPTPLPPPVRTPAPLRRPTPAVVPPAPAVPPPPPGAPPTPTKAPFVPAG